MLLNKETTPNQTKPNNEHDCNKSGEVLFLDRSENEEMKLS